MHKFLLFAQHWNLIRAHNSSAHCKHLHLLIMRTWTECTPLANLLVMFLDETVLLFIFFLKVLMQFWVKCPLFKLNTWKLSFAVSQGCSVAGNVHDHHFTKASFDLVFRVVIVWKLCPIEHFTSFILSVLCSHILIRLKFVLQLAFIKVYRLQEKSPLSCASKLCLKFKMK